ncbi:MAG: long-chain fatty acid--CoA ligase [FCB group bacterium]|nr:long-chain fatty acid--CoA ligase [FCB group bacterium]
MTPDNWMYHCQTFGNVTPEEYMVPFPNLGSLLEGRMIKDQDQLILDHPPLTIRAFDERVQQFRRLIHTKGVRQGTPVALENIPFPDDMALAFAIWTQGGILVLGESDKASTCVIISSGDILNLSSDKAMNIPHVKPLPETDAVWQVVGDHTIRLSHYNCLVNCYALKRTLNLPRDARIWYANEYRDSAWIILTVLLPHYGGYLLDSQAPTVRIGDAANDHFCIRRHWTALTDTRPQSLYYLPEHTAFVAVGSKILPFLDIRTESDPLILRGHAVMNGYSQARETEKVYTKAGLRLPFPHI